MILNNLLKLTQRSLNKDIISYLKSRGISKESATKWQIGYLPEEDLLLNLDGEKDVLYEKGILLRRIDKSPLNQYLTFPMYNQYGEIIGFSGRPPLDNAEVKRRGLKKYWHSKFDKRRFLFGLNYAIESARSLGYMIVCEGQFDTIIPSQYGVDNIVSTCGTALTEDQVILLSRYVDKVYVVFDNDDAGKEAFRQLTKHAKDGIELIPVSLPDSTDEAGNTIKEDPDSFVRKYGKDKFLECVLKSEKSQN